MVSHSDVLEAENKNSALVFSGGLFSKRHTYMHVVPLQALDNGAFI